MFTEAEMPEPHQSPPAITTATAAVSTHTQKRWSVADAGLVGASLAIALMLNRSAAQAVLLGLYRLLTSLPNKVQTQTMEMVTISILPSSKLVTAQERLKIE